MKIKEYIETVLFPKLSYHIDYSDFFVKQYEKFEKSLTGIVYYDMPINFYCWKDEYEEFIELLKEEKLLYKNEIVSENGQLEYLIEYSNSFEKGFDSVDYNTPSNVIISRIPFCSTMSCVNPDNRKNQSICVGRKNSKSKPCIAGMRPFSFNSFFGQGILRAKKINNITKERVLDDPRKVAFEEGVMFKSIFLVIERYPEFGDYFNIIDKQSENFIDTLLNGVKELQVQDIKCEAIRKIKDESNNKEEPFRDWFKTFFKGKYDSVNAEPLKGNGRIDLKIEDKQIGTKVLEFKGWWNRDKNLLPNQIMNYLTDFDETGFIILINHCKKKKIDEEYLGLIKTAKMGYLHNSVEEKEFQNTGYKYYLTKHSDEIRVKILYHFIVNVY